MWAEQLIAQAVQVPPVAGGGPSGGQRRFSEWREELRWTRLVAALVMRPPTDVSAMLVQRDMAEVSWCTPGAVAWGTESAEEVAARKANAPLAMPDAARRPG